MVVPFCNFSDLGKCIGIVGFNYLKLRQEFEDALQSRRENIAKQHLQEYLLYRYWHPEEKPAGFVSPSYPDMYLEQPLDHFDSHERVCTYLITKNKLLVSSKQNEIWLL